MVFHVFTMEIGLSLLLPLLGFLYTFAHFYPSPDLQQGRFHNLNLHCMESMTAPFLKFKLATPKCAVPPHCCFLRSCGQFFSLHILCSFLAAEFPLSLAGISFLSRRDTHSQCFSHLRDFNPSSWLDWNRNLWSCRTSESRDKAPTGLGPEGEQAWRCLVSKLELIFSVWLYSSPTSWDYICPHWFFTSAFPPQFFL